MKKLTTEDLFENLSISEKEIFFVSDIEHFSLEIKKDLMNKIINNKFKLIVLIGDILSGFSTENSSYKIFQQSYEAFEMFYDSSKIMKKYKNKNVDQWEVARTYVGQEVSERLSKTYSKEIKFFKEFINSCFKIKIPVILFSGNHDSLLSWSNLSNEREIPILKEIHDLNGLKIPFDLEKIKIGKDLFLMGIHVNEDIIEEYKFYPIKEYIEKLGKNIETSDKIIFVSHIPGKSKFTKLGSNDIQNFKKRFKFKAHYHGHCRNFHGEYLEEGIPTKSVHFEENEGVTK